MDKKCVRMTVLALCVAGLAAVAAPGMTRAADDGVMYGGPVPEEFKKDQTASPVAKPSVATGGAFLRGGMPINLTPGGYVAHDGGGAQTGTDRTAQPAAAASNPTSAAIHNQNLLKARARAQSRRGSGASPFPPGWGEFNQ